MRCIGFVSIMFTDITKEVDEYATDKVRYSLQWELHRFPYPDRIRDSLLLGIIR